MKNFNAELANLAASFSGNTVSPPSRNIPAEPEAIEAYFREILHEISEKPFSFYQRGLRLKEDYGLDSLDKVELIMYLENDLNIKLREHEWTGMKTTGEMLKLLFSRCLVLA